MFAGTYLERVGSSVGVLLVGLLLLSVMGCGEDNPFEQVPVQGTVTYEDESLIPAQRIRLQFFSQAKQIDSMTNPRPGGADVDPSTGRFDCATTLKHGDGLIIGPHQVRVLVEGGDSDRTEWQVTPAEIEVTAGGGTFDFKVKKE